jgi:polyisoprenoid-binding protein YceI
MRAIIPALAFATLAGGGTASAADSYAIDASHTAALFKINHLGFSNTWGRFNDVSGTVVWDDADPAASSVKVAIKTASIDTGTADKDKHLKSGDFFSVKEFPELTFVSKSVAKAGDTYEVTGDFTLHGVTKTITVPVTKMGAGKDPWGKDRIGFDAQFSIKRSDYGMAFGLPGIGDEVTIVFASEAVK